MKLLLLTQKVDTNDDVLGFFHCWLEKFSEKFEKIIVICLQKGEYHLPENVKVLSLGKEEYLHHSHIIRRLVSLFRFYKYIWYERRNYDAVFVHMNPEYVVLGGCFWKLWNKKIAFWYTHKAINCKLRLAEKIVDKIFTASKESFQLRSKKVEITGHGINTEKLKARSTKSEINSQFTIITVGRIAPVKNLDILIKSADILRNKNFNFAIKITGRPVLETDIIYFEELKKLVFQKNLDDMIKFIGPILHKDINEFYQEGDLFVNLSDTGSIDKTVLEAMVCSLNILTSNESFKKILPSKYLTSKNPEEIADKIINLSNYEKDDKLREYVVKNHNLHILVEKIKKFYE